MEMHKLEESEKDQTLLSKRCCFPFLSRHLFGTGLVAGFLLGAIVSASIYVIVKEFNKESSENVQHLHSDYGKPSDPEIAGYSETVERIVSHLTEGKGKGQAWNRLAELTDRFGHRMTGSESLEKSIDFLMEELKKDGFDKVYTEEFAVERWERRDDFAAMLEPFYAVLNILALGGTGPTSEEGITADVVVVNDIDDLRNLTSANGKIVVCNVEWRGRGYEDTASARSKCAPAAERVGAVAALVRSITQFSINSPHTGATSGNTIPHAAITLEDAAMMKRMQDRNQRIRVHLKISSGLAGSNGTTRNLVAEMRGSEKAEEIVMFGGHIDSWDVGVGAMDDGGGIVISWQAMSVMKELGLRPKRTTRLVMWSAEEQGGYKGGKHHFDMHKTEMDNISVVMESDGGTFTPAGLRATLSNPAREKIREISKYFHRFNASWVGDSVKVADIIPWVDAGVPALDLEAHGEDDKLFWFHHTHGDTMEIIDPDTLDVCSAIWTIAAYIVADLDDMLPRS